MFIDVSKIFGGDCGFAEPSDIIKSQCIQNSYQIPFRLASLTLILCKLLNYNISGKIPTN